MIREYIPGDELKLEANEFSHPDDINYVFDDDDWWKYTLDDDGVKVIMCFKEHEPKKFALFALFSKHLRPSYGKHCKKILQNGINKLEAESVFTLSADCPVLNRWHKFLGFSAKDQRVIDEKIFNYWAIEV